jgi:Protein of unknown function (DUF3617)
MVRRILVGVAFAGALCSAAFADALNVKPGLWETTVSSPGGAPGMGAIPQDRLANLSPEQRAAIEAAMRARGGGGSQPTVTKSCITAEQLSKPLTFGQDNNRSCKVSLVNSTRSKQEMALSCDNPNMKATGTLTIESQNDEHYTGVLLIHADGGDNGGMQINRKFTGKWISSDCGDVKPRDTSK